MAGPWFSRRYAPITVAVKWKEAGGFAAKGGAPGPSTEYEIKWKGTGLVNFAPCEGSF